MKLDDKTSFTDFKWGIQWKSFLRNLNYYGFSLVKSKKYPCTKTTLVYKHPMCKQSRYRFNKEHKTQLKVKKCGNRTVETEQFAAQFGEYFRAHFGAQFSKFRARSISCGERCFER